MSDSSAGIIEIAEDWPCKKCGYNLRGAAVTGLCPECAMPIESSVRTRRQPTWGAVAQAAFAAFLLLILLVTLTAIAEPALAPPLIADVLDPRGAGAAPTAGILGGCFSVTQPIVPAADAHTPVPSMFAAAVMLAAAFGCAFVRVVARQR